MPSLFRRRVLGGLIALVGALLAVKLNTPLPWLLGPLIAVASFRLASMPVACSVPIRCTGQWAIGASLGLYFTPQIVVMISSYWPLVLAGVLFAFLLGALGSLLLHRLGGVDIRTAWFSSAIGGASEMTALSEKYGGRADLVASAHSLRILMVVVIIPFAYQAWGVSGLDTLLTGPKEVHVGGLFLLIVMTALGGLLFQRLGISNSWVLGPLLVSVLLTTTGNELSALPDAFSKAGQLFIGWSLGDKYRQAFFRAAPRFLATVFLFTSFALLLALLLSFLLDGFSAIPFPTLMLAYAPGGIAEMAITAKVLHLGVPIVTAFQVSRMAMVVVCTGPLYEHIITRFFLAQVPSQDP